MKQVELARREAESERQFKEKERMGLEPPRRAMDRGESMVSVDRSGGGAYR